MCAFHVCVCPFITPHFLSDENLIFSLSFVLSFLLQLSLLLLFHSSEPSAKTPFSPLSFLIHMSDLLDSPQDLFPSSPLPTSSPSSPNLLSSKLLQSHPLSLFLSFSTAPIWSWRFTRCISYFGALIPTSKNVTYNEISLKIVGKRTILQEFCFSSTLNILEFREIIFICIWLEKMYLKNGEGLQTGPGEKCCSWSTF